MIKRLRRLLARQEIFSFNVVGRDRWISRRASELRRGTRVLDVGAGSCPYRHLFSHCEYRTQDLAPLRDDQLRDGGYGKIDYVSDASAIPVADASFGAVVCFEVLEHHPEPIKVVREFARITAPGGFLFLTAPLGSGIHQEPYHYYGGYTPYWYQKFLGEAGFDIIGIEANGGSYRHLAQETIRFVLQTRPFALGMPLLMELAWMPLWLLLAPILGMVVPIAGKVLDRFDADRRFTVGYHVSAIRTSAGSRPPY